MGITDVREMLSSRNGYREPVEKRCGVIPEAARGYPGSQKAPAFVTIPDNAFGISWMTLSEAASISGTTRAKRTSQLDLAHRRALL
jgi:hypothetical protein